MLSVRLFVSPGFQMLDLAGPLCAFQNAVLPSGKPAYRLRVLSSGGGMVASNAGLEIATARSGGDAVASKADTVMVIGGDIPPMLAACELDAVRRLAKRARRVTSVCTGAFLLAAAGLLDGCSATTHWNFAPMLRREYPAVRVESDRIFVKAGRVWTSAGITAAIDLALALIEEDLGSAAAKAVAEYLVVHYRRAGGQSQFSALSQMNAESDRIRMTLGYIREHLAAPLPVEKLAEVARISLRQFGRVFRQETGETPAKAVERVRAEAAHFRIEGGAEPIESVAASVGFHDPERMRRAFLRIYGQSPQALRRAASGRSRS